jgi:hypothetical protein
MKPEISAYMTSIRPYRWMRIHEMLSKVGIPFEIVIVGPIEADFELPNEIKFYKSSLKPSQCQHTAGMLCQADKMLQIVDDIDYQEGAIKSMYDELVKNDNAMATCHYHQNNQDYTLYQNTAGQHLPYLPLLPVCGMFHRQAFLDCGGIDKRFLGVMGELDLYMRMNQLGYKTIFVDFICNENTQFQNKDQSSLCSKFWPVDRPVLIDLWSTNNKFYFIRNDIVRKYNNENLLTIEQNV